MNNFVISINKSDLEDIREAVRYNLEELPEIIIYRTKSGEYFSNEVKTLINAISLLARHCVIASVNNKSGSIAVSRRLAAKQIAVKVLPISERTSLTTPHE